MSSIALFPCELAGGKKIIDMLSSKLDRRPFTDEDLVKETMAKFGGKAEKLNRIIQGKSSVFNQFTLERERIVSMFRIVLADRLLNSETQFFYGFHSLLFSKEVSEVLRVLVVDSKQKRIDRGVSAGLGKKEAKDIVKKHDTNAFMWTDFLFKKEAYDSTLYDLVIPAESRGEKAIVDEIEKYFHKISVLRTKESQQAVSDMKNAATVELHLLQNGHKIPAEVKNNSVYLTVPNSTFNLSGLKKELSSIVKGVHDFENIEFITVKTHEASVYRQQKFELPSKVLFVDDEKDFVHAVSRRLTSRDIGTYGVYNGEDALSLVLDDRPDVMVLDLKMPGLHGTEVLRRVKKLVPEIEVIILTGHGSIQDEQECMRLGAYAYLNKPVDIEKLSETIKAANHRLLSSTSH